MNLNSNKLPKGFVTLEGIFNSDDEARYKNFNLATKKEDFFPVPVGDGRTLNLGKVCTELEKRDFVKLCHEFSDVFSWTYDDLKGFDPSLFQHSIDLDQDAKHVRQK
jgi:hypothetical protein